MQGFRESDTAILLRVFDPTASRFSTQAYPVREVVSLSRMETSRSIAYPVLGSLAGAAVGASPRTYWGVTVVEVGTLATLT